MAGLAQYGKKEYWEERYFSKKDPFDWYQKWSGLKDVISQYIRPYQKILNVGCGTSKIPEDLFNAGYTQVTSVDYSPTVIEDMQEKYAEFPTLLFEMKDVRTMDYPESSFDIVFDKGTLDSIACGDRSDIMVNRMLDSVYRVLVPGGIFFSVSYAPPKKRQKRYFDNDKFAWEVLSYEIAKPVLSTTAAMASEDAVGVHFVYVCVKPVAIEEPGNEGEEEEEEEEEGESEGNSNYS